jgi:hypothetical protein
MIQIGNASGLASMSNACRNLNRLGCFEAVLIDDMFQWVVMKSKMEC